VHALPFAFAVADVHHVVAAPALGVDQVMDVAFVATAVVDMASLPLEANVQFLTVMSTKMPFVGRG
jgi:hypothetical protein